MEDALVKALQKLRDTQNALSPITPLHDDILALVFRSVWVQSGKKAQVVLKLSHVCRRWREVACANAGLWANIQITDGKFSFLCLERSKKASLTISLVDTVRREQDLDSILPEIVKHIAHIEEMNVELLSDSRLRKVLGYLSEDSFSLESIRRFHLEQSIIGGLRFEMGLNEYPRIQDSPFWMSMGHLTQLNLVCPLTMGASSDYVELLAWLPSLRRLKLTIHSLESDYQIPEHPYKLPHLRRLTFRAPRLRDSKDFLESISVPKLLFLKLINLHDSDQSGCSVTDVLSPLRNSKFLSRVGTFEFFQEDEDNYHIEGLESKESTSPLLTIERNLREGPESFSSLKNVLGLFPKLSVVRFLDADSDGPDVDLGSTEMVQTLELRGGELAFLALLHLSGRFSSVKTLLLDSINIDDIELIPILSFSLLKRVVFKTCLGVYRADTTVLEDAGMDVLITSDEPE